MALADNARALQAVFDLGVPVLGICYGQQTMCQQLGGGVEPGTSREFGRDAGNHRWLPAVRRAVAGRRDAHRWMSHGDHVAALPPGFRVVATSTGAPFVPWRMTSGALWCTVPSRGRSYRGGRRIAVALRAGCLRLHRKLVDDRLPERAVEAIRAQVGDGKVICGLSGGVDSSVAAVLIHEASATS